MDFERNDTTIDSYSGISNMLHESFNLIRLGGMDIQALLSNVYFADTDLTQTPAPLLDASEATTSAEGNAHKQDTVKAAEILSMDSSGNKGTPAASPIVSDTHIPNPEITENASV